MNKHTPGPWIVVDEKLTSGSPIKTIRRADGKSAYNIAVIGDRMPSPAQWAPNAYLLATAPELLQALKRARWAVVELGAYGQELAFEFDKVIAKAEGR